MSDRCDCIEIHRRNGKILHTFSRDDGQDWELTTPESAKAIRRGGRRYHLRTAGVWIGIGTSGPDPDDLCDNGYNLGDGIPPIREHLLHRILDGLAAAGISSIDSDGLIRLITARR